MYIIKIWSDYKQNQSMENEPTIWEMGPWVKKKFSFQSDY